MHDKRKAKASRAAELERLEEQWKATLREAREALAKAETIENAVFDLKAVNTNKRDNEDRRTPAELLTVIEEMGREADAALSRLRKLIGS